MNGGEEIYELLAALHKNVYGAKYCWFTCIKAHATLTSPSLSLQAPVK